MESMPIRGSISSSDRERHMSRNPHFHVALFGEFGIGNIGNDASCRTVLDLFGTHYPDIKLSLISRSPIEAERIFGIAAVPISATTPDFRLWKKIGPAQKITEKISDLFHLIRIVGRYDAVVVPGTGVLEAAKCRNPGGVIVWLLSLTFACWIRRVPLAWFAVGGSPYRFQLPARVAVLAARGASYLSFRDEVTLSTLRSHGLDVSNSLVSRDVVFARASSYGAAAKIKTPGPISTVAIAAIDYEDAGDGVQYMDRLIGVALNLLERGLKLVIVSGDDSDEVHTDQLVQRLSEAGYPQGPTVTRVPRGDFDLLSEALVTTDLVIGSRLHVLIAGVLLRRPIIALSHATKDDELLRQLELNRYTHAIETFSTIDIEQSIAHLDDNIQAVRDKLERGCTNAENIVLSDFWRMGRAFQLMEHSRS